MDRQQVNFIPVYSKLNWDEYFMLQAMMASFKSKDPNTKVGCVFVDQNNHHLSMGYNGMIAGIDESQLPWGNDRSVALEYQKYAYVVHAEANAISHAKASLVGSRLYVTLFPCHECAKLITNQRVKEVVFLSDKYGETEDNRIAKRIFDLAGIAYRKLDIGEKLISELHHYLLELIQD
jgi:dCMP deaminase